MNHWFQNDKFHTDFLSYSIFTYTAQFAAVFSFIISRVVYISTLYLRTINKMKAPACPYCEEQIKDREHFENCKKSEQIKRHAKHAIHFKNSKTLCLKCFQLMEESNYINHNRNCGRKMKRLSENNSEKFEISSFSIVSRQQVIDDTKKKQMKTNQHQTNSTVHVRLQPQQMDLKRNIHAYCENYLVAYLRPHLVNWLQRYQSINSIVLFRVFQKYSHKIVDSLSLAMPNIQLSTIYQISKKIDWKKIVNKVQQIYNKQLILSRVGTLSQAEKNTVFKGLNKIYSKYDGIFEPFKVNKETYIPKNPRDKRPLLPHQFIEVIHQLFSTSIIGFVLIALQILIIYQSGQRFPSSLQQVQQNLNLLLNTRKKKPKENMFSMISTKTNNRQNVVFDQQLLQLLEHFEWKKFSQGKRFYERLSAYFPFSCYSLRRGYICYMYLAANNDATTALRLLTNHKSEKSVNYYIRSLIKSIHLEAKTHLRIPNSSILYISKQDLIKSLPQFSKFTEKIQLKSDWFSQTFHKLKQIVDMTQCDCLHIKQTFDQPKAILQDQNINQIPIQNNQESSQSDKDQLDIEEVFINGRKLQRINKKFNYLDQYLRISKATCQNCKLQISSGFSCLNCNDSYHSQCLPQYFCKCHETNININGLFIGISDIQSQIKLKMPQMYIGNAEYLQELNQIKLLVFLRGLNYTNVGVLTPVCERIVSNLNLNELKIASISLPQYGQYQAGNYFPPLKLITFGDTNNTGTGFGLAALEDINETNIFLGQYCGDIFLNIESKFIQRKDMVMEFYSCQTPSHNISIGPIRFGGYVMLVNQSKKANCAVVRANVAGKFKILLYNTKKIRKNAQLFYNYSRLTSQIPVQDQEDEYQQQYEIIAKNQIEEIILINNLFNNCYINVTLQLLWKYKTFIQINHEINNPLIDQLSKFLKLSSGIYNPETFLRLLFLHTELFKMNQQSDAHQFLDYIFDQLQKQSISIDFCRSRKLIQKRCNKCLRFQSDELFAQFIMLEKVLNPFSCFQRKQQVIQQHICPQCSQKGSTNMVETFISVGDLLIFIINRFENYPSKNKYVSKIWVPSTIAILDKSFKRSSLILHKGATRNAGHYTFIDVQKNIEINDDRKSKKYSFNGKDVVIVVFRKQN